MSNDIRVESVRENKGVIRAAAGLWEGIKETGIEYERRLRKGWRKVE